MAEMIAAAITLAESRPRTLRSASTCPVAMVNMVSPSNMECAGRMAIAYPLCAIEASLVAWDLVIISFVAMIPIVVLPAKRFFLSA